MIGSLYLILFINTNLQQDSVRMCFHSRVVFSCGHHEWRDIISPCQVEREFDKGLRDEGCSEMWSHGFYTIRVTQQDCKGCAERYSKVSDKFTAIKERLQTLREDIERRSTPEDQARKEITRIVFDGLKEEEKTEAELEAQAPETKPNKLRKQPPFQVRKDLKQRAFILPLLYSMPHLLRQNSPRSKI